MNKGNSADDCLPKFFKVYLPDDSGDDLEIPISFNSYLPKSLPKNVIVRSIYGNIWKLELKKRYGDIEKFSMVNGWKEIVKDEDLKGGEFLAFEFDGSRLFNFCIYGHATCKRLGSSVKPKEIKDEPESEDGKSSVDIIVIDDDDDDDGDDFDIDDQDSGEHKSNEDIIVIDDDSSDDNDDVSGDQDSDEEDKSSLDIIVIDDDDDDDYADGDQDDDDDERSGVETESKEKGSSEVSNKSDSEDDRQYLDNDMNPFFTVNLNLQRTTDLRIRAQVIKDYGLHFPEFINLIDPLENKFGKLKRKVEGHTIKGFDSLIIRNRVKSTDKMICELEMENNGLVREIKVHVISG